MELPKQNAPITEIEKKSSFNLLPPFLTIKEARELFGHIEPNSHRLTICAPLPYKKLPGSNIIIKKDDYEESGISLARQGAMIVSYPEKPELEGRLIIAEDPVGQHQMKITVNKTITTAKGEVIENHPTDYLCIVIHASNIVCFINK